MPASVLPIPGLRTPGFVTRSQHHVHRLISSAGIPVLCAVGAIASLNDAFESTNDGAGSVPLVAMLGIALAAVRWRPDTSHAPSRPVTLQSALVLTTLGIGLLAAVGQDRLSPTQAIGPIVTVALVSAYLALWGYRSLALLRTVTILSLLTWIPIADFAHEALRSSLEQPSRLIYERLAVIPVFGVDDQPWRIFSAELHRGALVVLATFVLSVGANRWRVSGRTLGDIAATVGGALILHHAAILAAPIDTYEPTDTTLLATNPTLEIAIASIAVFVLAVVRRQRGESTRVVAHPNPEVADRDPFIFGTTSGTNAVVIAVLLLGMAPLGLVLTVG